jgi:hypothetical protein
MKLEQRTITTIVAEEGKLLVRKSDGWVAGERFTLGYDYYEAGVGLAEPRLATPEDFEEIDKPEDWEEKPIINQVQRLKRTDELIKRNIEEMNALNLSAVEALEVQNWYPKWEDVPDGESLEMGMRYQYEGKLYVVLQTHNKLSIYTPLNAASLYAEVVADENKGTKDNPIEYNGNMALEEGKYYKQYDVVYLCVRDTVNPVYADLIGLVGIYVTLA